MALQDITENRDDEAKRLVGQTFLRRKQAGTYLTEKYGFGAARTLAKAAVTGDGPEYHKAGRVVLYTREALDKWVLAKIGAPRRSTSAHEVGE
jgi:hypothetical protein